MVGTLHLEDDSAREAHGPKNDTARLDALLAGKAPEAESVEAMQAELAR